MGVIKRNRRTNKEESKIQIKKTKKPAKYICRAGYLKD